MAVIHKRRNPVRHGEQQVLRALSLLSNEWHVFYSVGFLERRGFDRQRELDFLLLNEKKGAVFVEVKGGQVRFSGGQVNQLLDGGWKRIDPVTQLNGARRVALDFLKERNPGFIPGHNLYCFPVAERPSSGISQELEVAGRFGKECDSLADFIEYMCRDVSASLQMHQIVEAVSSCLTFDIGLDAAEHAPRRTILTLRELSQSGPQTFRSLSEIRSVVGAHRGTLQRIWGRIASERTEIEIAEGFDTSMHGDLLSGLLRETENTVASSFVDVGVFGQVKRGKSTLVNALVGREVSSVGMLPKTAVPVTIEWSSEESGVIYFADGTEAVVPVSQAIAATSQDERRRRLEEKLPLVERVLVRISLQWLPSGVRLVDTPGLSDPSMTDVYEKYTLKELDRLSAGVLVISYPPGPDSSEISLLSSLSKHGLSKMFFVVNMWSDVWKKKSQRKEAQEYVEYLLAQARSGGAGFERDDARVYTVNLGMAREGQESGNHKLVRESGLSELQKDLADFMANDALVRIAHTAARRLLDAAAVIEKTLVERETVLRNPVHLERKRAELTTARTEMDVVCARIRNRVQTQCSLLRLEMEELAKRPFVAGRNLMAESKDRKRLRHMESRLSLEAGASASEMTPLLAKRSMEIVSGARNDLARELGMTSWDFSNSIAAESLYVVELPELNVASQRESTDTALTVGMSVGALLGLLATGGPIGAFFGLLMGAVAGSSVAEPGNSAEASADEVRRLGESLSVGETRVVAAVSRVITEFQTELDSSLQRQARQMIGDASKEIATLEQMLADEATKKAAASAIEAVRRELRGVTG